MSEDSIPAAVRLATLFERLGIDYWLGGSLASSIHGEPRSTHDVEWRDVLGVLKSNPGLDRLHLEKWAGDLAVADLLARAIDDAGLAPSGES